MEPNNEIGVNEPNDPIGQLEIANQNMGNILGYENFEEQLETMTEEEIVALSNDVEQLLNILDTIRSQLNQMKDVIILNEFINDLEKVAGRMGTANQQGGVFTDLLFKINDYRELLKQTLKNLEKNI